jgi:hypothetical protein
MSLAVYQTHTYLNFLFGWATKWYIITLNFVRVVKKREIMKKIKKEVNPSTVLTFFFFFWVLK